MKRRTLTTIVAGTTAALVVPLGVTASVAAWNDQEWVHASGIGTSSIDCTVDDDFGAESSGDLLSGSLLGIDLDAIAEVVPMELALASDGALDVSPPNAINLGSIPPTYTYANPLTAEVLGGVVGLDLTGFALPLPGSDTGAANQYAQVSGYGTAAGASGAVSNSGGLLLGPTPDDSLPTAASIDLTELLGPLVSGIAGGSLNVGAVGASSVLDGCAALRSALWGDGSVSGVTRDYGIASLGLELDSPLLGGLITSVNNTVTALGTAVDGLLGTSGVLSTRLEAGLELAVPGVLEVEALQGTVSLTGLDLPGAVSALLTTPLTDDVVTIDLAGGTIDVDLDALLGGPNGLNDLPPNTELLVNSDVLNPIIERVGTLLDNFTTQIVTALREELRSATLTVDLSTRIIALGAIPILNTPLLSVDLDLNATLGELLDGNASLTVDADILGVVDLLDELLDTLLGITITGLLNDVLALGTTLTGTLIGAVTDTVLTLVTTLGTTLTGLITPIVSAVDALTGFLPGVLSLMVNVQPDQPNAPPDSSFIPGTRTSTPQYEVSALRIGVLDGIGTVAAASLATASAGPVALP